MLRFVVCVLTLLVLSPASLAQEDEPTALRGALVHRQDQATVGTIEYLSLIDANRDEGPYTYFNEYSYGVLPPKVHIFSSVYAYAPAFTVTAATNGNIGSVMWEFDGVKRIENRAIWAMCNNNGRDIFPCAKLVDGFNSVIKATPFSGPNGSGTRGTSVTVDMKISKGAPLNLILVDARTDKDIGPIPTDFSFFNLTKYKQINIKAVGSDPTAKIGSTVLDFDESYGRTTKRIENAAPYAFFGHNGNDFFPFTPKHGSAIVKASAYSEGNGKGELIGFKLMSMNFDGNLQAPSLLNFSFVPPSSFNTTATQVVNMRLVVQDDFPGLVYAQVFAESFPLGFFQKVEASIDIADEGQPKIMNVAFPMGPSLRNGRYDIRISLSDSFMNRNDISSASLASSNFPSFIDVSGAPVDVTLPKLINVITSSPLVVDVAPSSATAEVKLVLEDDLSGVSDITLTAVSPYNGETYYAYSVQDRPFVSGKPIERLLSIEFDRYLLPGKYPLSIEVVDGFGNTLTLNSTSLAQKGFTHFVQVTRSYNDTTPPSVGTFNCLTCEGEVAIVDVSSEDKNTVAFEADIGDDLSGFGYASLTVAIPGGASKKYEWTQEENEGDWYIAEFFFDESSQLGVYELTLYMEDDDGNAATVTSADLIARGKVSKFTVIKSK